MDISIRIGGGAGQGIQHKGFALIDILQPCVSFNRVNTFKWYSERVYKIDADASYDAGNRSEAFERAQEWGEKIPIGIIYRNQRLTLEEQIPAISNEPLVKHHVEPKEFATILETFK